MKQTQVQSQVQSQVPAAAKQAVIDKLVKASVAKVAKMNGIGFTCFCCIGC